MSVYGINHTKQLEKHTKSEFLGSQKWVSRFRKWVSRFWKWVSPLWRKWVSAKTHKKKACCPHRYKVPRHYETRQIWISPEGPRHTWTRQTFLDKSCWIPSYGGCVGNYWIWKDPIQIPTTYYGGRLQFFHFDRIVPSLPRPKEDPKKRNEPRPTCAGTWNKRMLEQEIV